MQRSATWCCESTFGPPIAPLWLYGPIIGVFNQQNIVIYPKKLLLSFFIIHISSLCLKSLQRYSIKDIILYTNSILIHSFNYCSFLIVVSPILQSSSISFLYPQQDLIGFKSGEFVDQGATLISYCLKIFSLIFIILTCSEVQSLTNQTFLPGLAAFTSSK